MMENSALLKSFELKVRMDVVCNSILTILKGFGGSYSK